MPRNRVARELSLGEFYPPLHKQFCHHGSDAANGLINRRARSQVTYHSEAISQVLARTLALLIHSARGSKNTPGGYRVASATEVASESSRRTIGVFTGNSTFEPFVMNASNSLFAASLVRIPHCHGRVKARVWSLGLPDESKASKQPGALSLPCPIT
jgi:hypothetical protein